MELKRIELKEDGIFGTLTADDGASYATLEHAYNSLPKLPAGTYTCIRGQHSLHSGPIEAFEITNVPGHKGILIHPGNTEADSEGCVLIGESRQGDAIIQSRKAFNAFMASLEGTDSFSLTVS